MKTNCWKCNHIFEYHQEDIWLSNMSIMSIHQPYVTCPKCKAKVAVVNERRTGKTY